MISSQTEKDFVVDFLARNHRAITLLNDSLFYFGELGMQEFRSCELMAGLLEEHGFTVQRGVLGFPTAFSATYGSGTPVVAIQTEYDANPNNSQQPGVAEQAEIVPGAPGHCEGHNANGAVLIATAIAVRYAMERFGLRGTLKVLGAPAEEQGISRPYFVRDGYFDDVDVCFHNHVFEEFKSDYGLLLSAMISVLFTFHGETAHAAVYPWKGRDALDAVVLMDMGIAQYREHMHPTMTAHRAITNGGIQPNMIAPRASVWWYFRDSTADGARRLFERAQNIARGAAMMTETEVEITVQAAVWPLRSNQTLAELLQRNVEAVGMPEWTDEEQSFAKTLQRKTGAPEIGLVTSTTPLTGPAKQIPASNDCGDVSWSVPMGRLWFPANIPGVHYHHWSAGAALATSIAHRGALAGAQAMAASAVELFLDPALVAEAKESFRREIGEVKYRTLLPDGQQPPVHLNEATMEKFRPLMEAHYVRERPEFIV